MIELTFQIREGEFKNLADRIISERPSDISPETAQLVQLISDKIISGEDKSFRKIRLDNGSSIEEAYRDINRICADAIRHKYYELILEQGEADSPEAVRKALDKYNH